MGAKPVGEQPQFRTRVFVTALRVSGKQVCCGKTDSRSAFGPSMTGFLAFLPIAFKPSLTCPALPVRPTPQSTTNAVHEAYICAEPRQ
jgi:hypothetical protein